MRASGLPRVNRLTDIYNAVSVAAPDPPRRGGPDPLRRSAAARPRHRQRAVRHHRRRHRCRRAPRRRRGGLARRRRRHLPPVELAPGPPNPADATTPPPRCSSSTPSTPSPTMSASRRGPGSRSRTSPRLGPHVLIAQRLIARPTNHFKDPDMLIHPWDAALDDRRVAAAGSPTTDRFGVLAVNHLDPAQAPFVLPTHFTLDGRRAAPASRPPQPGLGHTSKPTAQGTAGRDRRLRLHPHVLARQGRRPRRGRRPDQLLHLRPVRVPPHHRRRPARQGAPSSPRSSPTSNPRAATPTVSVDSTPLRTDAARHPRHPPPGAGRRREVQVRRPQPHRPSRTRQRPLL